MRRYVYSKCRVCNDDVKTQAPLKVPAVCNWCKEHETSKAPTGRQIREYLRQSLTFADIARLHPGHSRQKIRMIWVYFSKVMSKQ